MSTNYQTNSDRILEKVLSQQKLIEYGKYNPSDYHTIKDALNADNLIVHTVAIIISSSDDYSYKEIYNKIYNYLMSNI